MEAEKIKVEALAAPRRVFADQARNIHVVTPEAGTPIEVVLSPDYWSTVAMNMTPWDRIEVRAEDGAYYAELLVLSCDRNWAKVKLLSKHSLTAEDTIPDPGVQTHHQIKWRGPHHKWSVVRNSDNAVLKDKMEKGEANTWLMEYLKAMR